MWGENIEIQAPLLSGLEDKLKTLLSGLGYNDNELV